MFDRALLDRIRAAVDIAEVVGEHVALRKAGGNSLKGLCPFHQEKTPSFNVNTGMQIFKCFGCGAAGSAFTFLMKIENIPFPEAVRRLAERVRIPLPQADSPVDQERNRLLQACETATTLYARSLKTAPEAARARAYLAERTLASETIERFRLGYAAGRELAAAKLHPALLAKAGLAGASPDGGQHDRMRGRLVIPITDETGRVVGFGGRALDEHLQPKYLNTPETPLFKKSSCLYGLAFAKDAIRKAGRAVLVEGYFDAIAAHAHGVAEVVAVLGTSLTDPQLRLLKRFAPKLVIVYDEDMGGNEAALRGLDLATEAGFEVRIARLPGATDPDEFLAAHGPDGFRRVLEDAAGGEAPSSPLAERGAAVSLFDFRLEVASRHADPATLGGRTRIVSGLLPFLAKVPNAQLGLW
ncbi:MAG: DNA primase [bacterium]